MKRLPHGEEGMALIAVLGILAVAMLVTATAVAISQTLRLRTATLSMRGISVYDEESLAHLALWLLMQDKSHYPDRSLNAEKDGLRVKERFQANGQKHRLLSNNRPYEVTIHDFYSGIELYGNNGARAFNFMNANLQLQPGHREKWEIFKNRFNDYIDIDDNIRIGGLERNDYGALGASPLPRNNAMQYREEILWIPGGEELIPVDNDGILRYVNLIPPRGLARPSARPGLLAAPPELLRDMAALDDREWQEALNCLSLVQNNDASLEEAFQHHEALLEKLKKSFSVAESGSYTIQIHPASDNPYGGRMLIFSLRVDAVPPRQGFQLFQWRFQ